MANVTFDYPEAEDAAPISDQRAIGSTAREPLTAN